MEGGCSAKSPARIGSYHRQNYTRVKLDKMTYYFGHITQMVITWLSQATVFYKLSLKNSSLECRNQNSLKPLWQSVWNLRPCLDGGVDTSICTQLKNFSLQS